MGRTKAQHNRENRQRYRWYKERGICTTCGRVWAEPGRVRCKECAEAIRAYHNADREGRMQRAAEKRQERIANGLCTECGKRPATEGMRMCPRCRAMRNDSTRKYKIHKRTLKGDK